MRRGTWASLAALSLLLVAGAATKDAEACGGTFCDTGPVAMPVDQTGENILFVMDGDRVEAHVQIQYTGDPERFAWVVPMESVPEVSVGSDQLFQNLLGGTVPSYGFTSTRDDCDLQRGKGISENASAPGGFPSDGSSGGGPTVVVRKTVGAFDVAVLEGGTAEEVADWLVTNGYQTDDDAPAILSEYVDKGNVFAAIKLTAGAGLDELQPLVFRYQGTEPCVPLKLTAIAAVEDMGVRSFFLGDQRTVPLNYRHVTVNPIRIDWANQGQNYTEVITEAADSPTADGHAFVTEYAGPSSVVSTSGVFSTSWDSSRFVDITPSQVVDELNVQQLTACGGGFCQYNHPMVLPLLQEYLPRPSGIAEDEFYSCLSCYEDRIDLQAWDGAAFAAAIQERIVGPGQHAMQLLQDNPYLTRMFTTISPSEMTVDPMFHERADMPDVMLPALATRRTLCDGFNVMILPDGREVAMPDANTWPTFDPVTMPAAETIIEYPAGGDEIVLVDNKKRIKTELARQNQELDWPRGDTSGCACSVVGGPNDGALPWLALAGVAGIGAVRLRRRRRG